MYIVSGSQNSTNVTEEWTPRMGCDMNTDLKNKWSSCKDNCLSLESMGLEQASRARTKLI
jgi:hypothetical protein